jgi:hypothetical protein
MGTFASLFLGSFINVSVLAEEEKKKDEAPLHLRVEKAVEKGVKFLKSLQEGDGSFGAYAPGGESYGGKERTTESHRIGLCALALYALLKSGVSPREPCIRAGFHFLEKYNREALCTYQWSVLILALEAKYNPIKKESARAALERARAAKRGASVKILPPIVLPKKDGAKLQRWVKELIKRRTPHAWRYTYTPGHNDPRLAFHQDMSATQMALLALNVASHCRGIQWDRSILFPVIDFCLANQEPVGDAYEYKVFDADSGKEVSRACQARGFMYNRKSPNAGDHNATGSMNAAGCASLIICKSLLRNTRRYQKLYAKKVDEAIRDSLAWMNKHWSVKENPESRYQYHYYMYGIERVGSLQNTLILGKHLWYNEGAEALVACQLDSGAWNQGFCCGPPGLTDTAFALLFLDRSTRPVVLTRAGKSRK